ncbi:glycoside hydrolase family 31 protein [Butyrivibrio sp. AD3002]|uniref:glycoside hydrolase family 31 protein n=1 Tax=Butyrivibrio sp. AD3002 TaxID=1280670 RepID=UPI0003B3F25F|nr:TIM-barrel domain-containing protein [Butyrivibrio sp. AD3002]
MMNVIPPKRRNITEVRKTENAVFLHSEYGVLRVMPQVGGIVRISFSEDDTFAGEQGSFFQDFAGSLPFIVTESGDEIGICTAEGTVTVSRAGGAVTFLDSMGRSLLREAQDLPRELEKITLYRTIPTKDLQVEEIQTADGVKKKVKAVEKEAYGEAYRTRTYFSFAESERLFGLGQGEHGEWDLRHVSYYVHQGNRKIGMPLLVSTGGYGILLSTESPALFSENHGKAFLQTEADAYLDYYFLFGEDLFQVVKNYRRLTGKASMLPLWAYGYMQSKERYESQEQILDTAGEFRNRKIGVDTLILDWLSWEDGQWGQKSFDPVRFPDPAGMVERLHEQGIHFMMSIWPNMSPNTENNREFRERGMLLHGTDIYNAFSEEARKLYWEQVVRGLAPAGVDAWWCDSSEPISPEWEHIMEPSDGEKYVAFKEDAAAIMPLEKANAYGRYHAMTIWEGMRSTYPDKRVVNLTRSGWAGSQKYGTILWSGDTAASWECLRQQIRCGLQMAASGMPYWTMDTGAFFVKEGPFWYWKGKYPQGIDDAYKKLYVRWLEWAAYLPIFRAHGTDVEREPWAFGDKGDPVYEAICETIRGRYRLIPYLYSVGAATSMEDGMIIRPLFFDFPEDERVSEIWDQYMLGDSLMICPVTGEDDQRSIYLPKGCGWYEMQTEQYYNGGQRIELSCELARIPVFVKEGSLIPAKEAAVCTNAQKNTVTEVIVYPGRDATFRLYEDAGDGYGYKQGQYCITQLKWDDRKKEFTTETTGDERFRVGEIRYRVVG